MTLFNPCILCGGVDIEVKQRQAGLQPTCMKCGNQDGTGKDQEAFVNLWNENNPKIAIRILHSSLKVQDRRLFFCTTCKLKKAHRYQWIDQKTHYLSHQHECTECKAVTKPKGIRPFFNRASDLSVTALHLKLNYLIERGWNGSQSL